MVRWRFILLSFLLGLVVLITAALGAFFFVLHNQCVDFSVLENYNPGRPTILLDDHGVEWARFQLDRRDPVPFERMPEHLIQAFIAAEDWSFFTHSGISLRGIVRSTLVNLYHGRIVQGASTITQQLVKLLFFDAKKTFKRKIQEQVYAVLVEYQFTKQHIMQTYLNHVYFGSGIYGVQAASQRFWGKDVSELTFDESAALAAIVRSPRNYCPVIAPVACAHRRDVILGSMCKLGSISPEQMNQIVGSPLRVKEGDARACAPHLKEALRLALEDLVGKDALYRKGLLVQTTLNTTVQGHAQRSFDSQLTLLRSGWLPGVDGALITLEVKTGAIKALVGGVDFSLSKFNRALQAKRQMGSTFKPLVYAAAIQQGASFADTEIDEPFSLEQKGTVWEPNNVYNTFDGEMTLAHALSHSNNIIAIKTFLKVGADAVVQLALKAGLPRSISRYPSVALGCVDAVPGEVAGMFNLFANDGVYVKPHFIKWVKDCWGNKLYKHVHEQERVVSTAVAGKVTKVLTLGLERVKRDSPQKWVDGQIIGKTGTSDFRTCWFVGSTPELTTAIYIGHDDNRSMGKNVFPIRTAFPIWMGLHSRLPLAQKVFEFDPSLQEVTIHERTGKVIKPAYAVDNPSAITIFE